MQVGRSVRVTGAVRAGQNIMLCGASIRKGDIVLPAGHEIRPAEIGLLAEVGRAEVRGNTTGTRRSSVHRQ